MVTLVLITAQAVHAQSGKLIFAHFHQLNLF